MKEIFVSSCKAKVHFHGRFITHSSSGRRNPDSSTVWCWLQLFVTRTPIKKHYYFTFGLCCAMETPHENL